MLSAAPPTFRRLVATAMIAAIMSFVLEGAAFGGAHFHLPSLHGERHASTHHHGDGVVHDHGAGALHTLLSAAARTLDTANSDDHRGAEPACAVVVIAPAPPAVSAPSVLIGELVGRSHDGSGIDPSGLKRPPRTPSIA